LGLRLLRSGFGTIAEKTSGETSSEGFEIGGTGSEEGDPRAKLG
jgi:hypothetical protein